MCVGQSFALMEMVLMASIMSQQFIFEPHPDQRPKLAATLALRPKHALHMIAQRRQAHA
jgi:cytochrome P450